MDYWHNDGGDCYVFPDSSNIILTGGDMPDSQLVAVSISTDAGRTWQRRILDHRPRGFIYSLTRTADANTIYAAGFLGPVGAVFVSPDRGRTWEQTGAAVPDTVYELAAHPLEPRRLFAATGTGLYVSTDAGASWLARGGGTRLRAVALYPGCPETLFTGGGRGVMLSTDGGNTWDEFNAGIGSLDARCLEFSTGGAVSLVCGTGNRACFIWRFPSAVVERPRATGRAVRVWPNPVRARLNVNGSGRARLLDITGRVVGGLDAPGITDVAGLTAGVYYLELQGRGTAVVIAR